MITHVTEGVTRISQCVPEGTKHVHVAQYLIEGENDEYVLVDTGSTYEREETLAEIEEAIGDGKLTTVLLTHSTLPHTENLKILDERWDDLEIIASTNNPTVAGLRNYAEHTKPKILNDSREFAGRRFSFLDPLITDVVATNWIYDHEAKMLVTAEGIGHYHDTDACALTSAEMEDGISAENVLSFNEDKLPFLKAVDPEKLRRGFEVVFDTYDVEFLAPIHGNVVVKADIERYIDETIRSVERIADAWELPESTAD
ncbi:MAG: MBL fold metallo-hydrolase [Halobacteriales archaeon]|nr:MBL fold metallo-hydrolase [Halobacteriales archaeon]